MSAAYDSVRDDSALFRALRREKIGWRTEPIRRPKQLRPRSWRTWLFWLAAAAVGLAIGNSQPWNMQTGQGSSWTVATER